MTVWPVKLVSAGVGGMGGWPMVRGLGDQLALCDRVESVDGERELY